MTRISFKEDYDDRSVVGRIEELGREVGDAKAVARKSKSDMDERSTQVDAALSEVAQAVEQAQDALEGAERARTEAQVASQTVGAFSARVGALEGSALRSTGDQRLDGDIAVTGDMTADTVKASTLEVDGGAVLGGTVSMGGATFKDTGHGTHVEGDVDTDSLSTAEIRVGGASTVGGDNAPVWLDRGVFRRCNFTVPREEAVHVSHLETETSLKTQGNYNWYDIVPQGELADMGRISGANSVYDTGPNKGRNGTIPRTTEDAIGFHDDPGDDVAEGIGAVIKGSEKYGIDAMQMGPWADRDRFAQFFGDLYVCMVDDDGNTVRRLDMWDLSKDEDGVTVPEEDYYRYQIMLAIPRRKVVHDNGRTEISTDGPGSCLAHTLRIGGVDEEFDELLIGMYPSGFQVDADGRRTGKVGSYTSPPKMGWDRWFEDGEPDKGGRYRIRPCASNQVGHYGNLTRENFRREYMRLNDHLVNGFHYADSKGRNVWMQTNWYHYSLLRDMALSVIQDGRTQEVYGFGYDEKTASAKTNYDRPAAGMCDRLGPFLGHAGWNNSARPWRIPVKLLVENLWGGIWNYIDDFCVDPSDYITGEKTDPVTDGDDTIPVWAGHNHPDCIDRYHDLPWHMETYRDITGETGTMDSDGRIYTEAIDGRSWATVLAGPAEKGPLPRVTDAVKRKKAWPLMLRDIRMGHHDRVLLGKLDVNWNTDQLGGATPYTTSLNYVPDRMHLDGDAFGLPASVRGGNANRDGKGLKDGTYTSAAKHAVAMWGGRAGHGPGSGLLSFAFAPEIDNISVNHGSRVALLRRKEPVPQRMRTAYAPVIGSEASFPQVNAMSVISTEITDDDGKNHIIHAYTSIGEDGLKVGGLEGMENRTVKVTYV